MWLSFCYKRKESERESREIHGFTFFSNQPFFYMNIMQSTLLCRTPLHCAASCNNVDVVKFLVDHGACIFATTLSDHETAAEKCEENEDGFGPCSEYLYSKSDSLVFKPRES